HDPRDGRVLATLLPMPEAGAKAASAGPPGGGEWFVTTPEGYYDASANAARYIEWKVGNTFYPAARFESRFHRPGLVRRALAGERITQAPLTVNDVPPSARL